MRNNNVQVLTRTGMLLALALVFQNLRLVIGAGPYTQFIIGSLVNAVLVVAVGTVNVYSALIISIIAPVVAYMQAQLPLPVLVPIVAIGNALIVIVFHVLQEKNRYVGILAGAVAKSGFLYFAVKIMLNMVKGTIPEPKFAKLANLLSFTFSWPQFITALIGGFIAVIILGTLSSVLRKEHSE